MVAASCTGMTSFNSTAQARRTGHWVWIVGSVLLAVCSGSPIANPAGKSTALSSAPFVCVDATANATATPVAASALAALRHNVETGPLYTAAVTASTGVTCRVRRDEDSLALEYQFGNGNSMRVNRDASIEYFELDAHFALPSVEAPEVLLARAEKAAFGGSGCGIDWRQPETMNVDGNVGWTVTVFRGDVCNCQTRVRRDAAGRVVGLELRSAC